ncbi:MAG: LamG domain-containing protein, partial [Candidatus Aenigmarchaeota archaeon]|nr:LamG domain-containing protein [Candidatus Aenigmarchaeota archaeon]
TQDLAGNVNNTDEQTIIIDTVYPLIDFVYPTSSNNYYNPRTYTYINVTTSDTYLSSAMIDWNNSLLGWWRFENDYTDSSTHGNDLSCSNCPTGTTGRLGDAYYFDAVNDYLYDTTFNYSVLKQGSETSNWTFEAWVKPDGSQAGNERVIVGRSGCHSGIYADTNDFKFAIKTTDCWTNARTITYTPPDMTSWHHLVAVYNDRSMTFYADGNLVGSQSFDHIINHASNTLYIGGIGSFLFKGTIDDVKIWNKSLSVEEINASYNNGLYRLYHNFTGLEDGIYNYTAYTQDLAGNLNNTETRTITVDTTSPQIDFVDPTDSDNDNVSLSYTYVNVTTSDTNNISSFIDWNNSLVGWYRFNSETDFTDHSTYSNTGTNQGSTYTEDGMFGGARSFDGSDYIAIDSIATQTGGSTTLTWESWIKTSETSEDNIIGGWNTNTGANRFWFDSVRNGGYFATYSGSSWRYTTTNVNDGEWHHICVIYNAGQVTAYIDMINVSDYSQTINFASDDKVSIGQEWDDASPSGRFVGSIDDVKIWDRTLNEEEINASYNKDYKLYHNFTSLNDGVYTYT